ncbi:hypothetical protein MXD62_05420 [Frankia sp. Mgl5]|nr:hypothetical protein [Frankia sp. Mgl5]MCK9926614.1 hypothetical protein [Frankia sp. Mgl5]
MSIRICEGERLKSLGILLFDGFEELDPSGIWDASVSLVDAPSIMIRIRSENAGPGSERAARTDARSFSRSKWRTKTASTRAAFVGKWRNTVAMPTSA